MMNFRYHRIVIKLGTSVLTAGTPALNRPRMLEIVRQCAHLHAQGIEVVLVSSGAIAAGRERFTHARAPDSLPGKQMLAAIGQSRLMATWEGLFGIYDLVVGQVLLTRADLHDRRRYLNARETLQTLIENHIVPIINENDAVATEEIRVGDNDNLSAMVAGLVEADLLLLLTDLAGLYTADPRTQPEARLIHEVDVIDDALREIAGGSKSGLGTGGMLTKLQAAEMARRSGTDVVIAAGAEPNVIERLVQGEPLGTRFSAVTGALESRKRWLLAGLNPAATLMVDTGAVHAIVAEGKSLLPVGVRSVMGSFQRGDTVRICSLEGREIARGLVRYTSTDTQKLAGHRSHEIADLLGYNYGDEVVHRNDLVLT